MAQPAAPPPSRLTDPDRLDAVSQTGLAGIPPAAPFDRSVGLVRTALGVPVAILSVLGERHTILAQRGLREPLATDREVPSTHSLCRHVVERDGPLVIDDATRSELDGAGPAAADHGVVAYLGVPVRTPSGHVLGALCAIAPEARAWTDHEVEVLEALAASVEAEVALQAESERRERTERRYREMFEASPDATVLLDPDTEEILDANEAASELYGVPLPELVGASMRAFSTDPAAGEAAAARLLDDGGPVQFDTVHARRDGTRLDLHVSASVVEVGGRPAFLMVNRDVTALREAEQALADARSLNDRLALVAANTTNGVIVTDAEDRVQWVNEGFERISGYTLDDMRGRRPAEVLRGPETDPETVAYMAERVQARVPFSTELINYHPDGDPYWVRIEVTPLVEDDGSLSGFITIESDVTDRREAEIALRESEARYRMLAETATDVILTFDERTVIRYANRAVRPVFGVRPKELVGQTLDVLLPGPLCAALKDTFTEYLTAGERRLDWSHIESVGTRSDGTQISLSISFGEFLQDGRRFFTAILRDVSAQKAAQRALRESEAQYRTLVETIGDAVVETDMRGRITFANPAWETITGVPVGAALGRSVYGLVHPDEHAREDPLAPVLRGGAPRARFTTQLGHADGEIRHVEVHVRARADCDGAVVGAVASVSDLTDTARFEAEREARQRSEEMLRAKDAFLNNMSHELRTPLTAILGFADVLANEAEGDQQGYAEAIVLGGRRLMDTLNSVLDLAQLEAGALAIDTVPTDLRDEATGAVALLQPMARQAGLTLAVDEGPPVYAHADPAAVARVLYNLVGNALKFTREGGVTVHVEADGDRAWLRVSDTGVGIPEAFRPHLFVEFTQASEGDMRTHEGSGLGLSITKRLVELMGGTIDVESEPGVGTTFTVSLPACAPPAPEAPAPRWEPASTVAA